jgi:outer membrane scaffolding protein for murein synthesis (MipA/OmpV family)
MVSFSGAQFGLKSQVMTLFKSILFTSLSAVSYATMAADIDIEQIPDLPIKNIPAASTSDSVQTVKAWQVSLGGGFSYAPRYEGAANDRLRFMPLLDASYNNGKFFISPLRGVGYNFSDEKDLQYGVRLSIGRGRNESEDPHLYGMGNIRYAPEAGLFLNERFGLYYISSGISSGANGTHAELGTGIGFPLGTADRLRIGVNLTWGDSKYSQTYFGVTIDQSAASGNVLAAYNASAGITDYALTSNWVHNYDKQWFSSAGLSFKELIGSAQESPLTQRSLMPSANFLAGYRF